MNVQNTKHPPLWKVLLIGGHSGVGKTVAARQLAHRFGVALAEVDDFRLVLERMTTPEQQPALHALLAAGSRTDPSPTANGFLPIVTLARLSARCFLLRKTKRACYAVQWSEDVASSY